MYAWLCSLVGRSHSSVILIIDNGFKSLGHVNKSRGLVVVQPAWRMEKMVWI
jgi:hypothetical protein